MKDHNITQYESSLLRERFYKIQHKSGLEIYIFPKKMSSTYAVFGTKFGSVNNKFRRTPEGELITLPDGVAHFLEHKLFQNEDGSDSFERFSEYGADANAYTAFDKTAYVFSCTDNFEASFSELLDFVTHPYFTEESVEAERWIIGEEIKMYDDNPHERCFLGMLGGMYHRHSIKKNICGSEASIAEITPELLYACHKSFYHPSNMVLVVCGDVTPEGIMSVAEKHLGESAEGDRVIIEGQNQNEPPEVFMPYVEQRMQVSKPLFCIGFKDVDIPSEPYGRLCRDIALDILTEIIFSPSAPLYSSLLENGLITPHFSNEQTITGDFSYISLSGESDDPRAVLDKVVEHISRLKAEGISEEELSRAKKVVFAEFVKNFDSTDCIANSLFSFACDDSGEYFLEFANIIMSIDKKLADKLLNSVFSTKFTTLSVIRPLEVKE